MEMEMVKLISHTNILFTGLDVKLGTWKKSALCKKENENLKKKLRILKQRKLKKEKITLFRKKVRTINMYILISYL